MKFLVIFMCVYITGCQSFVRDYIYFPENEVAKITNLNGVTFSPISIFNSDKKRIRGLATPSRKNARAIIIYLHGNGGSAMNSARQISSLYSKASTFKLVLLIN